MKTIKNTYWNEWKELEWEERLDITINTMFLAEKINVIESFTIGDDYGNATIELCATEGDDKLALTEGWIKIEERPYFEVNLWRSSGFPYYMSEKIWDDIYAYLAAL